MTQIDYGRAAKYFLLADFAKGFALGLKYFFAPKETLNYPHERNPQRRPARTHHIATPDRARPLGGFGSSSHGMGSSNPHPPPRLPIPQALRTFAAGPAPVGN